MATPWPARLRIAGRRSSPERGADVKFSEEDKRLIVDETCRPGQSPSAVARRYGIDLRLLSRWRRALRVGGSGAPTSFVSVSSGYPTGRPFMLLLNLPSPRYANGDVRLLVSKLRGGPNRAVFPDPMKSFPDERI
jgi:hypothetical protein